MAPANSTDNDASELDDQLPALQSNEDFNKDPNLMILSDEDASHVYTPPPRVAARIYHSGTNRRRSSAASSRRNSLSSAHSQHSNRSYRNACQSNHVAQYLRRASILENRKARLADRAAHAEQVRLRAAIAKAVPRVSHSEERALAAQQARQKYLDKVASACAEEVSRAKKVAEEMKERKAAEEQRCRLEMEEKHAEAERRRLEYRKAGRRLRTTSIPQVDGKKSVESLRANLSQATAATRIQRAWRRVRRKRIVKTFLDFNLSINRVRVLSFLEASTLLADENLIVATRDMMRMLNLDTGSLEDKTYVRRFLSAFMILGHPNDVFNKNDQQEEDLINKSKGLLISFESMLSELTNSRFFSVLPTQQEKLQQAYSSYMTAFAAWKDRDASVLIGTMIDQFVAFDAIWQTVKDDTRGEVANDYREAIRDQQVILLSKIKKLAGPERANSMIKKAIRESRRARLRQRPTADVRPRPVESASSNAESAVSEMSNASSQARGELELSELSRIFSVVPPNRILVHELLIDPNFKIEVSPNSDVRNALNREVCDSMKRGIEQGQSELWTVAVAENIRKRLLKLLRPGNSMHKLLSEVLDPDHVQNQCRQGLFSYEKFFSFMADILPRLCAPFRDPEVKAFAESLNAIDNDLSSMIEKLFGLLHLIDLMSLDYTNYMLQQAAPTLIKEASGYEQRKFQEDLEAGTVTLQQTKRWWRHASVNLMTEAGQNDAIGPATFAKVYARGLVDLAISAAPLRELDVPETLLLDKERFQRIRADMLRFTTVGAILLTAKNLLKRDVRSQWKPEARRIAESLREKGYDNTDGNLGSRILAIIESSHGMPQSSREQLSNIVTRFLSEASSGHLADPVLKLLFQRLKSYIFNRLAASSSIERVRIASTTSEGLAGIGLSEFIGQVSGTADELSKVASIDQNAHRQWYEQISAELDRMGDAEA